MFLFGELCSMQKANFDFWSCIIEFDSWRMTSERYLCSNRSQFMKRVISGHTRDIRFRGRLYERSIFTRWKSVSICIRQFSLLSSAETILEGSFEKNESSWIERRFNVSKYAKQSKDHVFENNLDNSCLFDLSRTLSTKIAPSTLRLLNIYC